MELQNFLSIPELTKFVNRYRMELLTGLIVLAVAVGGIIYWQFSYVQREQSALQALSELLAEYDQAYSNDELWQEVEVGARTGYRQYSRASMGPFFLVLQAEALVQQEKLEDAIVLMGTALRQFRASSPLYPYYRVKFARMKIASQDVGQQQEGLQDLTSLASDKNNSVSEQAQFYLAVYYQDRNESEKAQGWWRSLVTKKGEQQLPRAQEVETEMLVDQDAPSVWEQEASLQLKRDG